jgi:pimeloyl-ACP methyl ester carboxylesterase
MRGGWGRVERPDAEIWYHDTGDDLPIVVLLHGLAGYALEWTALTAELSDDYTVVSVEQRGHGGSTRRPADLSRQAYVDDVVAVLDHLGVDQVPLVGQSMGAHTAMLVAAEHPDRVDRLVMIEGGLGGDLPSATVAVTDWLESWPAPFADRDEFLAFFGGSRMVAETWADGLEQRADGLWPQWDPLVLAQALAHVHEREFLEEWSAVRAPTLLVRGQFGSVSERTVETMSALRPDLRVVTVSGASHDVHLERPGELVGLVREFIAR